MSAATTPDRLDEVVEAIEAYSAEHGVPPTIRDLMDALGTTSMNGLTRNLSTLRDAGRVTWEPGHSRTLRVVHEQ